MVGSSIVSPLAVRPAASFLAAAYYARPPADRSLADLRLAHGILATYWAREGRRIGIRDRGALRHAFGSLLRGGLDHERLSRGAVTLLGEWFPEAWADERRRRCGIAFETVDAAERFDPATRLRHGRLGALNGPSMSADRQRWSTYPPVRLPDAEAALALLLAPERWPDFSSAGGAFTPVRRGGLLGQCFEIHLAVNPTPLVLIATRGYVTCTTLELGGPGLKRAFSTVAEHVEALEPGATPRAYIELTTHSGHFMGRGISRLMIYTVGDVTYVRDVGSWDPLAPLLAAGYVTGGHQAQVAFWGPDDPESGLLAQLAMVSSERERGGAG